MPAVRLGDPRQSDHVAIEGFRRVEVGHVKRRFEDGGRLHPHATAICCRLTSREMPFLASSIRDRNSCSLKGMPSAVPCISTMPPLPVITKLASVPAAESSA